MNDLNLAFTIETFNSEIQIRSILIILDILRNYND